MFTDFAAHLQAQDRAPKTVQAYLSDLRQFARWFAQTNGTTLTPQTVTPTDLREYRQYLLTVKQRQAATINRHLAAITAYLNWGVENGLIEYNPAQRIRGVGRQALAPKWLSKTEQGKLVREVEQLGLVAQTEAGQCWAVRDEALVKLMLHTGLRAEEVCGLQRTDVVINGRSGAVQVTGKGTKFVVYEGGLWIRGREYATGKNTFRYGLLKRGETLEIDAPRVKKEAARPMTYAEVAAFEPVLYSMGKNYREFSGKKNINHWLKDQRQRAESEIRDLKNAMVTGDGARVGAPKSGRIKEYEGKYIY